MTAITPPAGGYFDTGVDYGMPIQVRPYTTLVMWLALPVEVELGSPYWRSDSPMIFDHEGRLPPGLAILDGRLLGQPSELGDYPGQFVQAINTAGEAEGNEFMIRIIDANTLAQIMGVGDGP